jgi:hypothetical protein
MSIDRQKALAEMHKSRTRPLCHCRKPGIEMYVAKIGDIYYEKRMPNTGGLHDPTCDHFEPPPELSGLGGVIGTAIRENAEDGTTELKFKFSMSKVAGRKPVVSGGAESDTVKSDGSKLTLRALLHYLWDQAGFSKWSPAMAGKRSWGGLRKYLYSAADHKMIKGGDLAGRIYIPETFHPDHKNEINQRRLALMTKMAGTHGGSQELMIMIGEVKEMATARNGYKMVVKHLPDTPIMMEDDIYKRLKKRFGADIDLSNANGARLIMIGTISVSGIGVPTLEEVALMAVTENWIPFESIFEKTVIDELTAASWRFIKGLRYNLPSSKPLASVVLSDTAPRPTAMYIIPPDAGEEHLAEVEELIRESNLAPWVWKTADTEMPEIPGFLNAAAEPL